MKNLVIKVMRKILCIFYIFKIKNNRIIFTSFHGESYTCSPKYITEYLIEKYDDKFEIIWAFNDLNKNKSLLNNMIKPVQFKSIKYIYYVLTSKIRINNAEEWIILPKRNNQILINTWHGGGLYKKVGLDSKVVKDKLNGKDYYGDTDLFLASCEAAVEKMYRKSFNYKGEVLNSGLPRNDLLFTKNKLFSEEIKLKLNINPDTKIVLYAPTLRESNSKEFIPLDGEKLISTLTKRFGGEWIILYRSHLGTNKEGENFTKGLSYYLDVSYYSDMQELLYVTDMLITDYSSSIWDYSFTKNPCILYVPDLDSYINEDRNFYFDIDTWGFPICKTNKELENIILKYDIEKYIVNMRKHHKKLGSYETGNSTKQVCEYILNFCEKGGKSE